MESFLAGILLIAFAIFEFVGGFIIGKNYWKEGFFTSGWFFTLTKEMFKSSFTGLFNKSKRNNKLMLDWFATIMYGFISFAPWVVIAVIKFAGGSASSTRTDNQEDYSRTYVNGSTDAMNGASPLHPENQAYMNGYNDYKNNHY